MVNFRNNNRRNGFRRTDRTFKNGSSDKNKFSNNLNSNENFQRKSSLRNNYNAPKLFEKYNNLAREALSSGDKILSENYFQHADHFKRIINESDNFKKMRSQNNIDLVESDEKIDKKLDETNDMENINKVKNNQENLS